MKSARSTPLLGLAFLISAITALLPAAILRAQRAFEVAGQHAAFGIGAHGGEAASSSCAAAISSRLTATILFRMSDMASGCERFGQR